MAEAQKIYQAIKEDDLKAFSSLFPSAEDLKVRLGRFPLLSLLYMYGAYQILDKYEDKLLPVRKYEEIEEPYGIYVDFKQKAKKSLRLYVDGKSLVEPAEMLAILDDRSTLRKSYKKLYRTDDVAVTMNKIYRQNHGIDAHISTGEFNVRGSRLTVMEKVVAVLVSVVVLLGVLFGSLSMALVVGGTGLGTSSHPYHVRNETEFISALGKDGVSVILDEDITLTVPVQPSAYSGKIDGNGQTLFVGTNAPNGLFTEFSGELKNLKIKFSAEGQQYSQNFGLIAMSSGGTISGVELEGNLDVSINSDYHITHEANEVVPTIYISAFVAENNGIISNSKAKVTAKLTNNGESNAYFSAFAGTNNGTIENCNTEGLGTADSNGYNVVTDTVDVAGIASENYGEVTGCTNNLSILQITSREWSPMVGGIVAESYGTVENCTNSASAVLGCTSTLDDYSLDNGGEYAMYVGGVVARNNMVIRGCKNLAAISLSAVNLVIYAGGITAQNYYFIDSTAGLLYLSTAESSLAKCDISATSQKKDVYVGGVVANNILGRVLTCGYEGNVSATTSETRFVAGIACVNYFGVQIQGVSQLLHSYIHTSYSNISLSDSSASSKATHFGYVFSYYEVASYNDRRSLVYLDIGALYDNHYVVVDTAGSVGMVRYSNRSLEDEDYIYGEIEDEYDGSTAIDSLDKLPAGRRINA